MCFFLLHLFFVHAFDGIQRDGFVFPPSYLFNTSMFTGIGSPLSVIRLSTS